MRSIVNFFGGLIRFLELFGPFADLGIRLWVGWVFWKSGMTKIATWSSTLYLFESEYQVPFLTPETAAYLGTAAELTLPVFLALGLAGRWAAIGLFAFNIIAVISYPTLNEYGVMQHQLWGLMLLFPMFYGPGKLSVDYLIRRKCMGDNMARWR